MLLEGGPLRSIAVRWSVSKTALIRHRVHIPKTLLKAKDAAEIVAGDTLMAQVEDLKSMARRLGKKAEDAGDYRGALAAVRELLRVVELLAKLTGQIGGDAGPGGSSRASVTIVFPVMSAAQLDAVAAAPMIDIPPLARRLLSRPSDGQQR